VNVGRRDGANIANRSDGMIVCDLNRAAVIYRGELRPIGAGCPLDLQLCLHGRRMRLAKGS
jgi:hypothetical protein